MTVRASGRVGGAGGRPTIRGGIIFAAGVQNATSSAAPDDHFAAGPDCSVTVSARGRVGGASGCPTVRAGIVSPAGVETLGPRTIRPIQSFRCRSTLPCE